MSKEIDFIVIGAPKSGTTSLFHYLRKHPQIYLPLDKYAEFFSDEHALSQGIHHLFNDRYREASSSQRLGKVTPQYMAHPLVPRRIKSTFPKIKLIALLRNPIDRAFSDFRMRQKVNREDRCFRVAALSLIEKNYRISESGDSGIPIAENDGYLAKSMYYDILQLYLRDFNSSSMLILFSEHLRGDPFSTLQRIYRHINVDDTFRPSNIGNQYHQGGQKRFEGLLPALQRVKPLKWIWNKLLPEDRRAFLVRQMNEKILTKSVPPPKLDPDLRRSLVRYFREDVRQLEDTFDLEVPWDEFRR